MTTYIQFQMRRDTAANWASANPVLAQGELGLDTTANRFKIGDGSTAWSSLGYAPNTVYGGNGAPSGGLGVNGDIYFDTTAGATKLYGPKAAGSWGSGVTLTGATGAPGGTGPTGPGVATGGTTGQVLVKNSATNFDTSFANTPVDNSTLEITGNNVSRLKDGGTTNAKLATMAAHTFKGNNTGSTGPVLDLTATQLTAELNLVTTTLQGMMSALDKKMIDNLHYDFVADFGGVGNDSTLNDTAMSTALSTMPAGAVLFFPSGTYRFANAIDINVDKRITFKGANRYTSIIKTTSATAHIFTKSVAGWYDMWIDLGFQSSVTKTAGAAINIPAGNNVGMNIYRCWFTGMFHAINATGAQSANLSVWADLDISGVANGGRGIVINGSTINVQIHNTTINAGAATTSACVEINQSGAVQVTSFDWIQGTNVLLINSTAGAGPQACYFTNGFFDQPQGSVVKIIGTNTANRIKFNAVGIAPTGNNYAVEINGTGAGAVGTQTALPAGLSFVDCDIYSANGTNTAAGIFVNGCQDVNIQNCRITGFAGAGGAGVLVTPSAGNQTKVRINGCIIGPNSNLTVTNETGVKLNAGASGLAALSITDNTMLGNTTAISDSSTMAAGASKNINNNPGAAAGLQASFASTATTLSATEAVILQVPLPANSAKVGTVFRFQITGVSVATVTTTVRVHVGPLGTTADPIVSNTAASAAGVAGGLVISGAVAVTNTGGTSAASGAIQITTGTTTGAPAMSFIGTFNSAVANIVTIGALCSASGHSVRAGTLDIVSPA